MGDYVIEQHAGWYSGRFSAMASPCEVLVAGAGADAARRLTAQAQAEARRIEQKFSRYRDDSVVARINRAEGDWVAVDDETLRLLDFADTCWKLSGGLFDITSGVLRRAWKFDGSANLPDPAAVSALLPLVGWGKVQVGGGGLRMPAGMEIDFGGIGKEYAVDRVLLLLSAEAGLPLLVNFGGDIATNGALCPHEWTVGVEAPGGGVSRVLRIAGGAMATSGDARRFLLKDGIRYGHILDPRDGWPVRDAPRSVTVAARSCVEAGMLSTMAILHGAGAEEFLAAQGVQSWILR